MSLFPESSSLSATATDSSSNYASLSSTPPTTVSDIASLPSESPKHDVITVAEDADQIAPKPASPSCRPRRARVSAPIYNITKLSASTSFSLHRADSDNVSDRRRTISGDTLVGSVNSGPRSPNSKAKAGKDAVKSRRSTGSLNSPRTRRQARESPRTSRTAPRGFSSGVSNFGARISKMSKRGSKAVGQGMSKLSRELLRLQDTKEYAGIDDKPIFNTVWSNGKFVDPNEPAKPAPVKIKVQPEEKPEDKEPESSEPITNTRERRVKKYLTKGLYAGQDVPADMSKGLTNAEKKALVQLPELASKPRVNRVMPPPIYTGFRMLIAGRDFKLPYLTCNPLPPGQPKPDEWKKMTKNRFIGDSKDHWRKSPHLHDFSKCVCKREDGCGDNCQNRIMLYECDETNCNVGKTYCSNRAFASLQSRRAKGGKYRVGVEVIKTSDRGYGVRSNRCFEPNQIIMEYAGEIITDMECERRMNEVYKDNECYYLMSFDQNMIIDATTGSMTRFVNHSCDPNCRMIKWIVSGQPRMALFAGDKPIMTGDELTYDYNFDPFSAKNVQKCLCGSRNCRGILGPRPREVKAAKTELKNVVKATVKAGKRKLKELVGDDDGVNGSKAKKRKVATATGAKKTLSKVGKNAATVLKKGVASITVNAKKAGSRKTTSTLLKKTTSKKVVSLAKSGSIKKQVSSRSSSLTIVAMSDENVRAGKKNTLKKNSPLKKVSSAKSSIKPRKVPIKKTTPKVVRRPSGKVKTPQKAKPVVMPF